MAVDMSQESVLKILNELYAPGSETNEQAKKLLAHGAKLTFGLFQFKVQVAPDVVFTAQLPAMSTKIVGNGLPAAQKQLIASKLEAVIKQAHGALPKGTPEAPSVGGSSISEVIANLKKVVDAEILAEKNPVFSEPVAPAKKAKMPFIKVDEGKVKAEMYGAGGGGGAKVDDVIALRDAKAIGQKVKGTSGGSVYNAVAIGPVNFGVKFTATNCSIRAESSDMKVALKKKLKDAGFTDNGSYFSMHLKLNGVNAMRAIGAVLYSMDIPFEAMGTTTAQVVS